MFKKLILFFSAFLVIALHNKSRASSLSDPRSDSLDILHTHISLDITDFANQYLRGYADIHFKPKRNDVRHLYLDLLRMQVDSVRCNNAPVNYSYNDTILHVFRSNYFSPSDTSVVRVYYRGTPQRDATWGGYYFQNGISYNIGVAFSAVPHNYGRVWFPCFDNFTERFTVSTSIKTLSNHKAFCGGILTSTVNNGDGTITWNRSLTETVPSYLVSVAVGPFVTISGNFSGINGTVPYEHGMVASDSLRFVNSFVNLETCFDFFEDKFGAYPFSRVGYVVVPFTGGAMEHATNIAYSRSLVNGTTSNECDFMAHELSHMWFGDKATCRTAEDMWLNEGWATFSGSLFREHQQGRQAYDDELRTRHDQVLRFTHIKEGGYQALSDVPWQYTYGEHVYNKGADVVHSLRGFLGDTVFFTCVKNYLSQYAYKDVSSQDLQESFEQTSGKNLQAFFDAFVYHGGFLDVVLDSFQVSGQGPYQVTVFTHQSIKGPAWACNQLPTALTLIDENRNKQSFRVPTNEAPSSFTFTSGIFPKRILINEDQSLALAQTAITKTLAVPGAVALSPLRFNLNVLSLSDTALCKITQHYTGPSGFPSSSGYRVSQERYFSVEGIFPPGFRANGSFIYDGRSFAPSGTQYFDNLLINETEDSLFLFFRENAAQPWMLFPYYTKIMGSATDKFGTMQIDSLLPGDYVLAMKDETAGLSVHEKSTGIEAYPNPVGDILQVKFPSALSPAHLEVYDALGKLVFRKSHPGNSVSLNMSEWPSGMYFLKAQDCSPVRFIVAH